MWIIFIILYLLFAAIAYRIVKKEMLRDEENDEQLWTLDDRYIAILIAVGSAISLAVLLLHRTRSQKSLNRNVKW